ncbi:MAG: A/G-specific adenine glycosylase [Acidobacteriia bacterium]|nr:A/G-specific adenine glycosylase [Terriglobia bacterium]
MSFLEIPPAEKKLIQRRLLSWFGKRKRDLPWRRTKDAYRIWLSEIMLQQTRVAAVIPYYARFLEKFPAVQALARAKTESVLARWAGLGYYSRARNLQRAAREIVAGHGGKFPSEYEEALALPGIGRYTAAAVLSIAYEKPLAVLDGNVARVLARIGAVRGDLRAPALWRSLEAEAQDLLAQKTPGDWNQAMMELGATVCTPKSPHCKECPVSRWCQAQKLGIAAQIPDGRRKRATVKLTLAAGVLLDPQGNTLLLRHENGDGALFSHLWQFPALETSARAASDLKKYLQNQLGIAARCALTPLKTARHAVTFRDIRVRPFLIHVERLPDYDGARRVLLHQLADLPISNLTRKIADAAIHAVKKID